MATYTNDGQIVIKDSDGNKHIVNPFTRDENVSLDATIATALNLPVDSVVADALAKLSGAALRKVGKLEELIDGQTFELDETGNGTMVRFVKLFSNYEGTGRIAVCRASAISNSVWGSGSQPYASSTLHPALNTTYFNSLSSGLKNAIIDVTIKVCNDGSTISTMSAKVFAPSAKEANNNYGDGTYIPALNALRLSSDFWLRTTRSTTTEAVAFSTTGSQLARTKTLTAGVLPMFTLPADFELGTQYHQITDMLGNDFPLPYAKIATGSYTGTGTYGGSNKNSLTFGFVPKLLIVTLGAGGTSTTMLAINPNSSYTIITGTGAGYNTIDSWGNTVSWHNSYAAEQQMNASAKYYYVAIG